MGMSSSAGNATRTARSCCRERGQRILLVRLVLICVATNTTHRTHYQLAKTTLPKYNSGCGHSCCLSLLKTSQSSLN
eukprot:5493294-Amphidinium_carterae.1